MPDEPPSTGRDLTETPLPDRGVITEGIDSYRRGRSPEDCPYPPNSADREAWRKGWDEAAAQDSGQGPTPPEQGTGRGRLMPNEPHSTPRSSAEHHVSHDRVFHTHEGWWCIVNAREFGPWPSQQEAAEHLVAERQRVAARKAAHDRLPLDGDGEQE